MHDGEKSSRQTSTTVSESISKLPQKLRDHINEISRQRDEWQKKYEEAIARTEEKKSRLRTIYTHWLETSGGNPDKSEFKQRIDPLLGIYSDEDLIDAISWYMADTEPRYISLKRFAETVKSYTSKKRKITIDPNSDLTITEQRKHFNG